MPDFTNLKLVEKLLFHGCESLVQVHPSIGKLINLSHLDLGQCGHLKEFGPIGQLTKLGHLDLSGCVNLKRLPEPIKQLSTLARLNLRRCHNLTQLPEQLGDMKCLKYLDASFTSIEQLPDSIAQLKELVDLKLIDCKKLRKLPAQIGNMESLKLFDARVSAIEHLPDTFGGLINLDQLHLSCCINLTSLPNSLWKLKVLRILDLNRCSKLEQLPEQLGKMQCLEKLRASFTSIEELPISTGLLSRLQVLEVEWCEKVKNLPSSIRNLTSLTELRLDEKEVINLPDTVKDMKLKKLHLRFNTSSWLPVIPSFSSLEILTLLDGRQIFSSNESYSLSKLSNLKDLSLFNHTSHECSFPELPLNLTSLCIYGYATLEMLPDLWSLKELKSLSIYGGISLQSLPPLPPNLEELDVNRCTSLQDLPDLSIMKKLRRLKLSECSNLKSSSLKQSFLLVGQHKLFSFEANTPDREVAKWFSYKSSGDTLSFTIPPNSGDNFFGIGLWIVYKCKYTDRSNPYVRAVITNKTKDIKENYYIELQNIVEGEVQSRIECIMYIKENYYIDLGLGEVRSRIECMDNKMKSGDRIKISFQSVLKDEIVYENWFGGRGEVKVKKCGAHLIPKTPSRRGEVKVKKCGAHLIPKTPSPPC